MTEFYLAKLCGLEKDKMARTRSMPTSIESKGTYGIKHTRGIQRTVKECLKYPLMVKLAKLSPIHRY